MEPQPALVVTADRGTSSDGNNNQLTITEDSSVELNDEPIKQLPDGVTYHSRETIIAQRPKENSQTRDTSQNKLDDPQVNPDNCCVSSCSWPSEQKYKLDGTEIVTSPDSIVTVMSPDSYKSVSSASSAVEDNEYIEVDLNTVSANVSMEQDDGIDNGYAMDISDEICSQVDQLIQSMDDTDNNPEAGNNTSLDSEFLNDVLTDVGNLDKSRNSEAAAALPGMQLKDNANTEHINMETGTDLPTIKEATLEDLNNNTTLTQQQCDSNHGKTVEIHEDTIEGEKDVSESKVTPSYNYMLDFEPISELPSDSDSENDSTINKQYSRKDDSTSYLNGNFEWQNDYSAFEQSDRSAFGQSTSTFGQNDHSGYGQNEILPFRENGNSAFGQNENVAYIQSENFALRANTADDCDAVPGRKSDFKQADDTDNNNVTLDTNHGTQSQSQMAESTKNYTDETIAKSDSSANKDDASNNTSNGLAAVSADDNNNVMCNNTSASKSCDNARQDIVVTPDSDLQRISPELFHIAHFSPTEVYGKDHTVGYQKWPSARAQSDPRPESRLNTPDPLFYDETDSNDSTWMSMNKFYQDLTENPIPHSNMQYLMDESNTDVNTRGTKRAIDQVTPDDYMAVSTTLPSSSINNIVNQGRPPDISTWTALSSTSGMSAVQPPLNSDQYTSNQWNKPTCAVPPSYLQHNPAYSATVTNTAWNSAPSHIYSNGLSNTYNTTTQMYAPTAYNAYPNALNSASYVNNNLGHTMYNYSDPHQYGMSYPVGNQTIGNYNLYQNTGFMNRYQQPVLTSQYSVHQNMMPSNYQHRAALSTGRHPAIHRLDFSSPTTFNDQTPVLNFVSSQSYLPENVSRPRPVLASDLSQQSTRYCYDSNATTYDYNYMSPPSVVTMGQISTHSVPAVGQISTHSVPTLGQSSTHTVPAVGQISTHSVPTVGQSSTHTVPAVGQISTHSVPTVGQISTHSVPAVGQISTHSLPAVGQISTHSVPAVGQINTHAVPAVGQISTHSVPAMGHISTHSIPAMGQISTHSVTTVGQTNTSVGQNNTSTVGQTSTSTIANVGQTSTSVVQYNTSSLGQTSKYTVATVGQTNTSAGQTSLSVGQNNTSTLGQTSTSTIAKVGQTSTSVGQTSTSVGQTRTSTIAKVGQTNAAVGQTNTSTVGQTNISTVGKTSTSLIVTGMPTNTSSVAIVCQISTCNSTIATVVPTSTPSVATQTPTSRPRAQYMPRSGAAAAVDLSKKVGKSCDREVPVNTVRATTPVKLVCQPGIPVSMVMNQTPAPVLAYSGATLVPYINSIFAAMANFKRIHANPQVSAPINVSPSMITSDISASMQQGHQVPLHQSLSNTNLMMAPIQQVFQQAIVTSHLSDVGSMNPGHYAVRDQLQPNWAVPGVNVSNLPLPLYSAPLPGPIRPLMPVVNYQAPQGANPYLYKFSVGCTRATTDVTAACASVARVHTATAIPATPIPHSTAVSPTASPPTFDNNYEQGSTDNTTNTDVNNNNFTTSVDNGKTGNDSPTGKGGRTEVTCKSSRAAVTDMMANRRRRQKRIEKKNVTIAPATVESVMPIVNQVSMTMQGSKYKTAPIHSRGLVTYDAVPDALRFPSEPRAKTSFKARRYNFNELSIGTYKHTCGMGSYERIARVKFLFRKKVMVYEYQLVNNDVYARSLKQMVEIMVPFNTIVGLWLYDRDMRIEVDTVPKIDLGSRGVERNGGCKLTTSTVYNRKTSIDVTENQLAITPYHYIQFKAMCVEKIRSELVQFDKRFHTLLKQPYIMDVAKSLTPSFRQITSDLLDPSIKLPNDQNNNNTGPVYRPSSQPLDGSQQLMFSCNCTGGCSSSMCQCCVKGVTCTEGVCMCTSCKNPLNVLHQLGLPAAQARTDPCLMENIYQIKRLDCYVKMQLMVECCSIPILLFNCIPGVKKCPNPTCPARYKYSWCTAQLCNEDVMRRNHCLKCGRCTDYRNAHCQTCNVCFFSGESRTFKCPICHVGAAPAIQDKDSSSDSDQAD